MQDTHDNNSNKEEFVASVRARIPSFYDFVEKNLNESLDDNINYADVFEDCFKVEETSEEKDNAEAPLAEKSDGKCEKCDDDCDKDDKEDVEDDKEDVEDDEDDKTDKNDKEDDEDDKDDKKPVDESLDQKPTKRKTRKRRAPETVDSQEA